MSALACGYALFADAEEAERIGQPVVEDGLAGCVNMMASSAWHDGVTA
ncbi:hypothetical protein [Sphingomonas sanxanigenens]|uniref:Uncharacterized protein n=1 Tax=Sphingomonas sanxanigenens DSM 19645 = NX02 TaxID=1123269 RepID=W0A9C8_9SPHN|nr:hypothetical protein [Sphingomonas sanxanigenens]AHE54504.1 hypothetical protein NX02_14080 [Sphingomonas sanxanigenens DSM 19645 = NX02]